MYTVTDIAPTDAEFTALIAALDAWQETLYPAESNHLLDLSQLPPQTVIAWSSAARRARPWLRGYRPQ